MRILSRDAAVIAERGTVGHWTVLVREGGSKRRGISQNIRRRRGRPQATVLLPACLNKTGSDSRPFALSMGAGSVGSIFVKSREVWMWPLNIM